MFLEFPIFLLLVLSIQFGSPLFITSTFAKDLKTNNKPIIDAIEGSDTITLISGSKKRDAAVSSEIEYGERVKTDDHTSVSIRYPDGSKIVIATSSEFRIEAQVEEANWSRLNYGAVRGLINKSKLSNSSKHKFIVRTRSLTLGVRGTDFVMSSQASSNLVQVHTLEGAVEVSKSEATLMSGRNTLVSDGQFVETSKAGITPTKSFNKQEFLKTFNSGLSPGTRLTPSLLSGSSDAPTNSAGEGATTSTAAEATPEAISAPSTISAPSHFPKLDNPAENQPRKAEASNENQPKNVEIIERESDPKRKTKAIAFEASIFFTVLPDHNTIRAVSLAWTPLVPVPLFNPLWIRGRFGADFAQGGSLNNGFLIYDYQVFLVFMPNPFVYVEGGIGEQIWKNPQSTDAGLASINAGLNTRLGFIDRFFVGYQALTTSPVLNEYKAGIGISF